MASIKCSSCGLNSFDSDMMCRRCGAPLSVSFNQSEPQNPNGTYPTTQGRQHQNVPVYGAPPAAQYYGHYAGGYGSPPPAGAGYSGLPAFGYGYTPPADTGIWQDGSTLVMYKGATLPDRCVKCNKTAYGRRLLRNLSWHHPALALLCLVGLIGMIAYAIIAGIVKKKASVEIGLCEDHHAARRTAIIVSSILAIAGLAGIAVAIGESSLLTGVIALCLLIAGAVGAGSTFGAKVVTASKIDDNYVWVKGAGKSYLSTLPPLPRY